jgi:hypothetical protein
MVVIALRPAIEAQNNQDKPIPSFFPRKFRHLATIWKSNYGLIRYDDGDMYFLPKEICEAYGVNITARVIATIYAPKTPKE